MDVKWWIGVVENTDDKEKRGRIQVRILGIHTNEIFRNERTGVGIPTEDLPWAICCMPLTFGGTSKGTVPPPGVLPGAWVIGIAFDEGYQNLLAFGVISLIMSPLALHDGTDLGMAEEQPVEEEVIEEEDSCEESFNKAIKNLTESSNYNLKANNIMMMIQYMKQNQPDKYTNFVKSSGIDIADMSDSDITNDKTTNSLLAQGYYKYCLDQCQDPVIAAMAYAGGYGKTISGYKGNPSYLDKYGDPRQGKISYEELADKISSEDKVTADFMKGFIKQLGDDCMSRCVLGKSPTSQTTPLNPTQGISSVKLPTKSNVITSKFLSENRPEYGSKNHMAIDLRAHSGDPIMSMSDGVVEKLSPNWGGVTINHGSGIKTRYLHMRKTYVKVGDSVTAGQQIGESGNKGLPQCSPHLHFEVWKNGVRINPETFLSENGINTVLKPGA